MALCGIPLLLMLAGCKTKKTVTDPIFQALDSKQTGIGFVNKLTYNKDFNLFKYIYFYNGSGVGAGDFNNDGLVDLFFGSNQGNNQLYLNTGKLHFKDVSVEAKIPVDGGWTTGISVADVNNDGLLDIYVSRVGEYETLKSRNQLLICGGIDSSGVPYYSDQAEAFGLNFSGFSTQAAFLDYDLDGDLDMYLLNHSVHQNGTFAPRKNFEGTYHPLSGDRLFRNDGGHFTDVTRECGINSTAIGYGLGIAVSDINLDGYPDIYIGNDFHENDYLYINDKKGHFVESGVQSMMHTSQFSMGVDVADVNNDARPEIISMDMLPSDPVILKRSLGEDAYDIFRYKLSVGYSCQFTRNNLQYNRGNGLFSETGLYSGIAATDWSWAPLWMDFDNDGLKDLFVSNGIPKRMNDIDYVNFVSDGAIQQKINGTGMEGKDMALINKFPEIKLPNKFYRNTGNLSFEDQAASIAGDGPTYSNGSVYADLDNDGDLDIVVNNIEDPVLIYENKHKDTARSSVSLVLNGPAQNLHATGAKFVMFCGQQIRTYEKFPVKGFLSSMEIPMLVGLANTKIDSAFLIWPDSRYQPVTIPADSTSLHFTYNSQLPFFDYSKLTAFYTNDTYPVTDITSAAGIQFFHEENHFIEFDREQLIPHMLSTEGPALAVGDMNHDGLEDIFLGAARNKASKVFLQNPNGKFTETKQPALEADSIYENVAASLADINKDGYPDLLVASGGNEFYGNEFHNTPRVYVNDGAGHFTKLANPFTDLYLTASCIVPFDFNGDGYTDIFIGGRAVPYQYGKVPQSYLLQNDQHGHFTDVTASLAKELVNIGFVTNACLADVDQDHVNDLVVTLEWGGVQAFLHKGNHFEKKEITGRKGFWNFILPVDIDGDGDTDFVAGNLGLNSRLQATEKEPVRMYYNDFDDNGTKEQLLTYYLAGREIPFANKAELEKQTPFLKKKYLYAEEFAKAHVPDLYGKEKLNKADLYTADYFPNALLINKGNGQFEIKALPWQAQLTSMRDAAVVKANDDNLPDILIMGNYYDNNIQMGRYDADYGTLLINRGKDSFECRSLNGVAVKGQVRHLQPLMIGDSQAFVLARNNDSAKVILFNH